MKPPIVLLLFLASCQVAPQLQIPQLPLLPLPPGVLDDQPTVTTGLPNARTELALLDDFAPEGVDLATLPQDPPGEFILPGPGVYELDDESFCLHAGTHAPGSGDGYLYAPLAGPRAGLVSKVIHNSALHPDIPERDIQVLLWGIVDRVKVVDMSRQVQVAAATLLEPADLVALNGGAVSLLPDAVKTRVASSLPPLAREVFEARQRLRELLMKPGVAYEELERVAVLAGDALGPGSRDVPAGRWSYRPDGVIVRFFPEGYSETVVQAYVPESLTIDHDQQGRITAIDDGQGRRFEVDYDDANPPTPVPGDPAVVKIAVTSLRALEPTGLQGMSRVETRPVGSVLFGLPSGTGRPAPGDTGLYQNAVGARRDIEALPRALGGSSVGALAEAVNVGHLLVAARAAEGPYPDLLARAWGFAVCRYAGACSVPAAGPSRDFGFRSNVAVPANTAKQRLAMGGRPKGKRPPKKPKPSPCEKLRAAVTAARDEADARARAYADKTLRNPDNVDQYEKDVSTAVDQMLKKGNTESGSKYGGSGPSVDDQIAGTGQDCQTHITDQGSYDGLPPPVKDGTDKHEATHRNQCTGDHTTYRGGGKYPSYRGDLEADAYRAEVAFYNQWLADHPCPGN